jgi:small subunit ribosomal protein S4
VNGKTVNIPSYQVQEGDTVEVREKSKKQVRIIAAMSVCEKLGLPEWVEVNVKNLSGVFKRVPDRDELSTELEEKLVVELYSK